MIHYRGGERKCVPRFSVREAEERASNKKWMDAGRRDACGHPSINFCYIPSCRALAGGHETTMLGVNV